MALTKTEILKTIARDKAFLDACSVLASNGEEIDFKNARLSTRDKTYSMSWQILKADGSTNVAYHKLSLDHDGTAQTVYFDDKNCSFVESDSSSAPNQKLSLKWPPSWWPGGGGGGGGGGGFCWFNWSAWVVTGSSCGFSFFCFFNSQRAWFQTMTRRCITNPNNVQTATVKIHCGC